MWPRPPFPVESAAFEGGTEAEVEDVEDEEEAEANTGKGGGAGHRAAAKLEDDGEDLVETRDGW